MKPEEVRAASRLGARVYSGIVANIENAHLQIAASAFRHVPLGAPVDAVHDVVARAAYGVVRHAGSAIGGLAGEILPRAGVGSETPIGSKGGSNHVMAAINATIGDRLAAEQNPLAIATSLRSDGRDLPLEETALRAAFPGAGNRVAVFVHGLGETEVTWRLGAGPDGQTYGTCLADDFGYTPVYVRYNTGRHISLSGRELAELLDRLVELWPAAGGVSDMALVGHSMGGLVIRSACHYGREASHRFVPVVTDVFCLGSPHLGAPLARWAHLAGWALNKRKQPLPFGSLLTELSAGIDDLRHGYVTDEDWRGCTSRSCLEDHRRDIPLLVSANHYTISATVSRSADSPVGRVVGDLLVQPASAHGRKRRTQHIPFLPDTSHELGGRHHLHLLNDPAVYEVMAARLREHPPSGTRAAPAGSEPDQQRDDEPDEQREDEPDQQREDEPDEQREARAS